MFHLLAILAIAEMYSCEGEKQSGNYKVKITSMEPCEARNGTDEQMGFFNTRMSKINRTHTCVSGVYSLPYGLNDDMQETWEIFLKGSTGGWKKFLSFKNKKACFDKKRLFPEWFEMLKLHKTSCPIPRGSFKVDCHNLTGLKFSRAKVMTYGVYRAKVNFYLKKVNIGCTDFIADITPSDNNPDWLIPYLKNDTVQ